MPAGALAFTWCQVPVMYQLQQGSEPALTITWDSGEKLTLPQLSLSPEASAELFQRSGRIRQLSLRFGSELLFAG